MLRAKTLHSMFISQAIDLCLKERQYSDTDFILTLGMFYAARTNNIYCAFYDDFDDVFIQRPSIDLGLYGYYLYQRTNNGFEAILSNKEKIIRKKNTYKLCVITETDLAIEFESDNLYNIFNKILTSNYRFRCFRVLQKQQLYSKFVPVAGGLDMWLFDSLENTTIDFL